jgi:hypothetical protein
VNITPEGERDAEGVFEIGSGDETGVTTADVVVEDTVDNCKGRVVVMKEVFIVADAVAEGEVGWLAEDDGLDVPLETEIASVVDGKSTP